MIEALIATYLATNFLLALHLIDIQLDDKHSISLLQLIALQSFGAKAFTIKTKTMVFYKKSKFRMRNGKDQLY